MNKTLLKTVSVLGFDEATPIQVDAIPLVLQGNDIMGLAQTGTGKTAAFGLPLVQNLMNEDVTFKPKHVRALILAPTRELVTQIYLNIRSYVKGTRLRAHTIMGGVSINSQVKKLAGGTDIVVATPGRLLDLVDRNAIKLGNTNFMVLDEADQMLDLGFIHSLRKIAKLLNNDRQTLLFSATMPKQIEELSQTYLKDPIRVETAPVGKPADKITQSVHFVQQRAKTDLLKRFLRDNPDGTSLVFHRTKHGAEKLMKHLVECGFNAGSIHGNKSQGQRDRAIKAFKSGELSILVATDVAARGIDIPGVTHVYNFNLPEVPENYVHRIGRTARAGADGIAIAFCSNEEAKFLRAIEKVMGRKIDVASGELSNEPGSGKPAPRRGKPARKKPKPDKKPHKQKKLRGKPAEEGGSKRSNEKAKDASFEKPERPRKNIRSERSNEEDKRERPKDGEPRKKGKKPGWAKNKAKGKTVSEKSGKPFSKNRSGKPKKPKRKQSSGKGLG